MSLSGVNNELSFLEGNRDRLFDKDVLAKGSVVV